MNPFGSSYFKNSKNLLSSWKNQERTTSLWAKLFQHFFIILRMEVIYQNCFSDLFFESSSLYMGESMVRWFIFGLLEPNFFKIH